MAETTLKSRLLHCAKTTAQWTANATKVGKKGELLLEIIDTNHFKVKVGDGTTAYSSLPYLGEKWGDTITIYNITNTSTGTTKIANGDTLETALGKIQANLNTLNDKVYVTYYDTIPNAPTESGSAGTSTSVSRGDHIHPYQSVTNVASISSETSVKLVGYKDGESGYVQILDIPLTYDVSTDTLSLTNVDATWKGLSPSDFAQLTSGKISLSVIPDSVLGQLEYIGTWNAATGVVVSDTRDGRDYRKGDYYIIKVAGATYPDESTNDELDGLQIGDWIVYNGTDWDKIDNTDYIKTVCGITPTNGDISIDSVVTALNAKSLVATTLKNSRSFSLSGDVSATAVSFNGSNNVTLSTTIGTGKVTTTKIADANVTETKLAYNSVSTAKIVDGAVTNNKLGADAVTNDKLADNAVQTENIVDASVTTDKIANSAVIDAKIVSMNSNKLTQTSGDYLVLDGNFF